MSTFITSANINTQVGERWGSTGGGGGEGGDRGTLRVCIDRNNNCIGQFIHEINLYNEIWLL